MDLSGAIWFFSGWATGVLSAGALWLAGRYVYKRLFVWPHHPVYKDPEEPNL